MLEPVRGPELIGLLERSFAATSAVLKAVPPQRRDDPTPCEGWTVGQLGGHLVGGATYFGRSAAGMAPDLPTEEPRSLGDDTTAAFREAVEFNLAAFRRPGVLDADHGFVFGPTPGWVIASISLSEVLLHGWDLARALDLPYSPDDGAVDAVLRFQMQGSEDQLRAEGMFAPAEQAPPNATPLQELVAFTGRLP
ncbi:TIGR03086 family protein [Saccharopolyspora flava]|uniref:TIGR03086 family protein n=2 Tax=Saccharopolyspora flava TaxID=95161 RepID=A0A1I6Q2B8_9PSEU|nr:TIGR03086 family protein [Saccharopolyspora flava]